jgi:HSP20 family protein
MAESGTSKQRTEEQQRGSQAQGGSSESQRGESQRGGIQRGGSSELQRGESQHGGIQRAGGYVPSVFSLSPREFFTVSPLGLMRRFADEMDRAFSNLGASGQRNATGEDLAWMPVVEVRESDNQLIVNAELPGLTDKDVRVEATPEGLVIQGERQREYSSDENGFQRSERSYGRFWRLIPLPEDAQVDQAKANFENGVLQVTIPIPESQQQRRQIPISGGGTSTGSQQSGGQRARSASQGS